MDNQNGGVATQTSQNTQYILTLDEFQKMMEKTARLGSLRFVTWMRKEGLI